MNHLQEIILDRFMEVEYIGDRCRTGLVAVAASAVAGRPVTALDEMAAAVGYPVLLCQALAGANAVLPLLEDRRRLAISVFADVPPQPDLPPPSFHRCVEIALWSARYGLFLCNQKNSWTEEAGTHIEKFLAGSTLDPRQVALASQGLNRSIAALRAPKREYVPERHVLSAFYFALHGARRAQAEESPAELTGWTVRDGARVAGLLHGAGAAADYCLALARNLGL